MTEFVRFHVCDPDDPACRCPVHDTPMIYSAVRQTHACQDVDCVHGHGYIGLSEGDRVAFTGYAPSKPEIPGVITTVLAYEAGHPFAGRITGYIIEVDGGHGATLCAEPHQLHRVSEDTP